MIVVNPWSRETAFLAFARNFIVKLANDDYGEALVGLDVRASGSRWSKTELHKTLTDSLPAEQRLTDPATIRDSARARVFEEEPGSVYQVIHPLPVCAKWSRLAAVFRFVRRKGEYFSVSLEGIRFRTDRDER